MIETFTLKDSTRKDKRYMLDMGKGMNHHFGSATGQTYIDHQDDAKKRAWIARHQGDKNWDQKHSGIYHSRYLLWAEPTLKAAIRAYERKHKVKIINNT